MKAALPPAARAKIIEEIALSLMIMTDDLDVEANDAEAAGLLGTAARIDRLRRAVEKVRGSLLWQAEAIKRTIPLLPR